MQGVKYSWRQHRHLMMEQFYLRHMTENTSAGMTLFVTQLLTLCFCKNQSKTNIETDKRTENSNDVILQLPPSIDDIDDSDNSQLQSSPEMYFTGLSEFCGKGQQNSLRML